jgi:hypothetical protein
MDFLKTQKNQLADVIIRNGFKISNFIWEKEQSQFLHNGKTKALVHKLKFQLTDYYFIFDYTDDGQEYNTFSPGERRLIQSVESGSWERQLYYFGRWLEYLKRETNAPDLWSELSNLTRTADPGFVNVTDLFESPGAKKAPVDFSAITFTGEEKKALFSEPKTQREREEEIEKLITFGGDLEDGKNDKPI